MSVSYSCCAWADLAHAGWTPRILARKGEDAEVSFTGPQGLVERRLVPANRLGARLRAQYAHLAPRRQVKERVRIN